jgi:lysozyme
MNYIDICMAQLPIDEGKRNKPYKDTVGILTIGVGRNLEDVGLRDDEIALMLKNDIAQAELDARSLVPGFDKLTENRKAVLVNMSFNLGKGRLSGFVNTLANINAGNYAQAADGMLASKWAVQVGKRADRLAKLMREG